jgi:hypothetical protein
MPNRIHVCQLGVLIFARLATGLCRQAQARDHKAGAWTWGLPKHPIPFTYILIKHGTARSIPSRFLCAFLDCTYPSSSSSPLSAEDDDGKLDSYLKREWDVKGHIPYQCDVEPNEYNSSRMATFNCGTTNAHRWYVNGSNSQYVAFSSRQPGTAS